MSTRVSPQIFLVSLLAGRLNQEQQRVLDYLQEENRVLKEQLVDASALPMSNGVGSRPRGRSLAGNCLRK